MLLLSALWHLMMLYWPLIHMGRLWMYLLLHSHCLLLHAWLLLLGLLHGCGLGSSKLSHRTSSHMTVTHWRVWSPCLSCLKATHAKLLRALLLLLLLLRLLPSRVRPGIAKHNFSLRWAGLLSR